MRLDVAIPVMLYMDGGLCHKVLFLLSRDVKKHISFILVICDMITRNESDVGDVVFEILANTVFKFLCFIMFLALSNNS